MIFYMMIQYEAEKIFYDKLGVVDREKVKFLKRPESEEQMYEDMNNKGAEWNDGEGGDEYGDDQDKLIESLLH